ncbi:YfhO family protein [Brachyspira sp.]|uniref:YfhO family protein n=1 Tax=Brachyspira sp. TaxID=1977261 RepID=UPI003D7C743B
MNSLKLIKKEIKYPVIFAVLSVLFFYSNLTFSYLQMGDVILWEIKNIKDAIANGNFYFWNNAYFTIAASSTVPVHPKSLLMFLLPVNVYPQVSVMFHITIMGYGLFWFLREKKLSIKASMFGAIALMFSNAMITLILPGHLGKFETYCYFPFVLYFLSKAMNNEKWTDFFFAGAFLGIAFLGGALDVAMYFALFLAVYFLYLLYNKKNELKLFDFIKKEYKKIILLCLKFLLVAVFSFLMSIQIIMITKNTQDMGAAGVSNKKELWDWATRWSYPPEEFFGFFIPGLFGYYSGSETHPYWGRIANMSGEPKTSNYSLTSANIGYITFLFIIFTIFISRKRYKEKYFWIGTALFFLIASFGRYFPLIYGALFQIPIFRDARNPNKFIEIIPIPFAIISSFAADYIFKAIELKTKKENNLLKYLEEDYKYLEIAKKIMYVILIASFILMIITILGKSFIYDKFLPDWQAQNSELISKNIFMSFIRLTLISSVATILIINSISLKEMTAKERYLALIPLMGFILFSVYDSGKIGFLIIGSFVIFAYIIIASKENIFYKYLPYIFMAILFLDLTQSGNMFIVKSNVNEMYNPTPITEHILKENNNETTIPILIPYLYRYTTHTMPYYKIPLTEPPAASRLSSDITETFGAFRINDYVGYQPRLMDLLGARYILSPTYLDSSIIANDITKITEYQDEFSAAVLYELKDYRNKYEFVGKIYEAKDFNDGLNRLKSPDFNLSKEAVIINYSNNNLNNLDFVSLVEMTENSDNKISFNIKTPNDGILISKERYNSNWKVKVNGEERELLNANLLFRGVYVEAGDNEVIFEFMPDMKYFYSAIICWIVFIVVSLIKIILFFRKE